MVKQKKKKKMGRPPKSRMEKTVKYLSVGFNAYLAKTLDVGCEKLERETGGLAPVNAQRLIQILVERLARDLARKEFSILSEYLDAGNGDTKLV